VSGTMSPPELSLRLFMISAITTITMMTPSTIPPMSSVEDVEDDPLPVAPAVAVSSSR